ncbi:hypothetical protein [Natronobacterium texcoconense]|uniref:Uncharacterized protein n=1 Tax=Natronobacterium texcoconense TaxID=1095778 RepID=A0A1H1HV68_NATTX|nr:hypothetical protein [Natronobacterium texcoconense]SDR29347.1 hypothetical protein SAMN04489842_3077 [Natronobacterium texcoconense]
MKPRHLLGLSLFVAVLLIGGIFFPAVFSGAYESEFETPEYYIAHNSTTEEIEPWGIATENDSSDDIDPTPLEDLDDEKQSLFMTIYEEQQKEVYNPPVEDKYSSYIDLADREPYTMEICSDWVLTCDAYEQAPPSFPTDSIYAPGTAVQSELTIVEYEGETYVVIETYPSGSEPTIGPVGEEHIIKLVLFAPLSLAIGVAAVRARESYPKTVLTLTGYGIALLGMGLIAPYLHMFTETNILAYALELVLITWSVILVSGLYLWRSTRQLSTDDQDTADAETE